MTVREGELRLHAKPRPLSIAIVLVLATVTGSVHAQPSNQGGDARQLFRDGEAAYRVGDYEAAVQAWQRAYQIEPRPRIQYNLAQAYERLGRLTEAIEALDVFVRATPPDDALYGEASARLAALRQRAAMTGVRIVGGPAGAQIYIDGQTWGALPRPDRIPTAPGNHQVSIVFVNGSRHDVAIVVPAGQVVDVQVPDAAGSGTPVIAGVEDPFNSGTGATPPPDRGGSSSRAMLIAGSATAGVGLLLVAYGIDRQVALHGCSDLGFTCLNESSVKRERTMGFVLGGALLAGGVTLVVLDLARHRHTHADVDLGVGVASFQLTVRH